MKIPLNLLHNDDIPIWRFSKNGDYSIRSAYYQLMKNIIDNNHLKVEGNWKKLWKLQVPNTVKLFLWRALCGCLPVRGRLVQKGIPCNNKCPHEWHCFFGCLSTYKVWWETDVWQEINHFMTDARGFVMMMFEMIEKIEPVTMSKIAMMLWTIWWRRNQKCWQDRSPTTFEVKRRATENLHDWLKAQQQKNTSYINSIAP
jgi:hypothetical protein